MQARLHHDGVRVNNDAMMCERAPIGGRRAVQLVAPDVLVPLPAVILSSCLAQDICNGSERPAHPAGTWTGGFHRATMPQWAWQTVTTPWEFEA